MPTKFGGGGSEVFVFLFCFRYGKFLFVEYKVEQKSEIGDLHSLISMTLRNE